MHRSKYHLYSITRRAARRSDGLMVDDDPSRLCLKGSSDPSSRATFAILYNQSPWIDIALRYHRVRTALEGADNLALRRAGQRVAPISIHFGLRPPLLATSSALTIS